MEPIDNRVATGFPSLDEALGGGLYLGELAVLGGEAGSGKSALALGIAMRAAANGIPTLFATSEMRPEQVRERALAIGERMRLDELRNRTRDGLADAARRVIEHGPRIALLDGPGVASIERVIDGAGEPLALLVVDPLQSLASGTLPLAEDVAAQTRELKTFAVRHHLAVLATSLVGPFEETRADRRPRLADFGALGAIAQHADLVLGLFREEMHAAARGIEGATELLLLKHRRGSLGYVDLYFYKQWLRFEDVMEPDA